MARKKLSKGLGIVVMYVSTGVKLGAGGIAIVNGKVIKVPPRGPANQQLQTAVRALVTIGKLGRR